MSEALLDFFYRMKAQEKILEKIHKIAEQIGRDVNIMEVCGTHTQAVSRYGIRSVMPKNVHLLTGPGCPVCVTAQEDIDAIVSLALAGIPIATYGDMLRVPGYFGSLEQAKRNGAQVFTVYSTEDALELQKEYPELVFFGLGFETTTPMTAYAIQKGLSVYSTHKLFIPAMHALLNMGEVRIDGFLDPGHVSAVIGTDAYKGLEASQVITGFNGDDILVAIYMLLLQILEKRKDIENEYRRAVKKEGNPSAYGKIFEVFEVADGNWRGFGIIPGSGLEVRKKYEKFDAKKKYKHILDKIDFSVSKKATGCKCDRVIRGLITPDQCPMFGKTCTPEKPYGPCMVSVEGGCNVHYRYRKQ
ncbi:MAG TPA: hydrogenase formation protein HypD [Candidatus Moranbacteria bacterium]|nr:hydrogenase formation protein HypD [Candidatus Moranbacteria bacterium]